MKVGFVGCGYMARIQIPYVVKIPGVQLIALCDKNEIRVKELAQQCQIPYYTELEHMLKETHPDVVHILTPPQTHAALAIQALKAGCHVFVEKPLCLTLKEADAIYTTAQSAKRLVSVDYNYLWSPLVQKAKQIVDSGKLGRVINIQYTMADDFLEAVKKGYGRWALKLPGGIFCDLIPHPLSLICTFLSNAQIVSAHATGTGINDLHELWVDFTGFDAGATLWMSLRHRPLKHNLSIYCTRGNINIDLRNFCISIILDKGLPGPIARVVNTMSESWQRCQGIIKNIFGLIFGRFDPKKDTAGAIKAFYKAIAKNTVPPVSSEEAKAVVKLSATIWDMLKGTPGAIRSTVDGKEKVIERKNVTDFVISGVGNSAKVLVTGGTGFIGSHLVHRLVSEGRRVRVLCRPTSRLDALSTDRVELALGDASDLDSVRQAMKGIEVLYHLAAATGGDWATHYQGTVIGTQNVLQAAAESVVKKVVYVSSLGVLNASRFPNRGSIDENFSLEKHPGARGDYSRAKLEAEKIAQEYIKLNQLNISIMRPGLVYGPGVTHLFTDAGFQVSNRLVLVVGLGRRLLGLTYVENLVDALLSAEKSKNSNGEVFHIVDDDQPSVWEYIHVYQKVNGNRIFCVYIPVIMWLGGFRVLELALRMARGSSANFTYRLRSIMKGPRFDTSKACKELGWTTKIQFTEGMARTFKQK